MNYCIEYIEKMGKDNNYNYEKLWWGYIRTFLITEAIKN